MTIMGTLNDKRFPSHGGSFKVISHFKRYDRKEARVAEVAGMRTRLVEFKMGNYLETAPMAREPLVIQCSHDSHVMQNTDPQPPPSLYNLFTVLVVFVLRCPFISQFSLTRLFSLT